MKDNPLTKGGLTEQLVDEGSAEAARDRAHQAARAAAQDDLLSR